MPIFFLWLGIAIICYGGFIGFYDIYLERNPYKVLVVIDTSQEMRPDWVAVHPLLKKISSRRYSTFALASEKDIIHNWAPMLVLGDTTPNGSRDFSPLKAVPNHLDLSDSPQVHFITNAAQSELNSAPFIDWHIYRPNS